MSQIKNPNIPRQTPPNISPNSKPIPVKLVLLGIPSVLSLGESAVGKSSIITRYVNGEYESNREPTIGGILDLF